MEPDTPLSPERNPREATNTSSDARPFHVNYPFLPLWEVQVMSDSREDENHDCFALKACSLCAMDGRRGNLLVEADFVEDCYSLIGSMKNWILSSSQSSFAPLSHEIDLL
ncbi:F-box/kelch-repeat protein At3g06240-like isoform X2, partial [Fagus crenata]